MITLVIKSLHSGKVKKYELEKMYDFDRLVMDFGPAISHLISDLHNVRIAADRVAEYLSHHHLSAEVLDAEDHEEIYDPNVQSATRGKAEPEKAIDLKDVLESYDEAEHVDIPEYHTLNAATHRWDQK